jgi:5-methylcytosine-specific restriction endonuclease McrA
MKTLHHHTPHSKLNFNHNHLLRGVNSIYNDSCYNPLMDLVSSSVLVLNANYEPINVCSLRRALGLIVAQKATLVLNGRGEIRTARFIYEIPSIIRLQKMVNPPRLRPRLTRSEVFRRDNYTCQYCGKHTLELTIDHVIPRHSGGQHTWTIVVAACPACNHRKGGRPLAETGMALLRAPKEPPTSAAYLFGRHIYKNTEWEPFIQGW